jgi:integration host factor subunit beta
MINDSVSKSQLIERISEQQKLLQKNDVELAVNNILQYMVQTLVDGDRVEIRGFGSFSLNYRKGRIARNPKTGESVAVTAKHAVHFKPGKELSQRVNC